MGQSRVHLLLRGLVGQVEGLGCCRCVGGGSRIRIRCYTDATGAQRQKALTRCCLLVLLVLDRTGGRMAGRTAVLWGAPLLGLARGGCRGLWVLWVWVQGGTRVWVLLRHWPWRHCSTERNQTKPIISWA